MTVQAAIEQELDFLRAENTAAMTSRVNVQRKTGATVLNGRGFKVPGWEAVYSDLPFRLVPGASREVTIGGVTIREATARGDMPWDTTNLADNDLLEVISGEWAGSVFRIVEAIKGDDRTARRVPIVEAARPEEWA